MAGKEDLPYWNPDDGDSNVAGRDQTSASSNGRRVTGFVLLGLLALGAMAGLGYLLGQYSSNGVATDDDESQLQAEPLDEQTQEQLSQDSTESDEVDDGPADDVPAGDDPPDENTIKVESPQVDASDSEPADNQTGTDTDEIDADLFFAPGEERPTRYAVFDGQKLYLKGKVPSQEITDIIVGKAEAVVGPGNVIEDYEIDPSITIASDSSAPLFVKDVVLFEFDSTEIAEPFLPLLDLGVTLLAQNPQASMTVVTHTDSVGSDEVNLNVSQLRAQSVKTYMVQQGANPEQIELDARGERGASPDDDAETAAIRRRAEFIITGLLN